MSYMSGADDSSVRSSGAPSNHYLSCEGHVIHIVIPEHFESVNYWNSLDPIIYHTRPQEVYTGQVLVTVNGVRNGLLSHMLNVWRAYLVKFPKI